MIIKHKITDLFQIKGKLHILDVIGIRAARLLKPGKELTCVFQSPAGEEYEIQGSVAFEMINFKGRPDNLDKVGGSLVFDENPNGEVPNGWELFVHIESERQL